MFSGYYIQHQELNRSDEFTRVIQIWFVADPEYMGLPPHYQQLKLDDMITRQSGDGIVRDIIGPGAATDSHVNARLTSTIVPAGGQATIELPHEGEDLFLYIVDGQGRIEATDLNQTAGSYDVLLASPQSEAAVVTTSDRPLNYLSFYLQPFLS
jgi:redox-sensitive bicupin YhaK (pirin superfamily)